ncbi:MAG TPA: 16S rRNA (cytosine(1402)-N(4))-methyltransferase RsmH [Verrucomicrobiae bacterium]|nr:16S rRNA (cytosine(1402)-N(4))-methyltransferase RsmH [Verrucomicrobiae bacterium]
MTYHKPVLLQEVVHQLQPRHGGLYVDCTVGGGGHAREILRACGPDGKLVGLDWDEEAVAASREELGEFGARVELVRANYVELERVLMSVRVTVVDGVLFDLGVSSRQFDEPTRGFSILREGPLDMRMSRQLGATARDILRTASLEELARIFYVYGEEKRSRAIARNIVAERENAPLETTRELARLVERVLGPKRGAIHPATRVFQALRIAVNNELDNLRQGLEIGTRFLRSGARIAVISFHSLEDRIVKQFFVEKSTGCICPPDLPVCRCGRKETLRIVTKKPIRAAEGEVGSNPRARSAKLRVAEKI